MKDKQSVFMSGVRLLILGLLFVFPSIILLLFLLTLSPGEKVLRGFLEKQLQKNLQMEVHIGKFETNFLSRIQIENVSIHNLEFDEPDTLLILKKTQIHYRLFDLLHRKLSIHSIVLDGLSVSLNRDSTGSFNLPILGESAPSDSVSGKPGFSIQLDRLLLQHASLTYWDARLLLGVSVDNLSSAITRRQEEKYSYRIRVDSVGVEYQDMPLSGNSFELGGVFNEHQIQLDSVSAQVSGLELTGNGELMRDEPLPSINGEFLLRGNSEPLLQSVHKYLPRELTGGEGDLEVVFHLQGNLDHPKVSAQLDLPDFVMYSVPIQKGHFEIEMEPDSVTVRRFTLHFFGGELSGGCNISLDSLIVTHLFVKAEQFDVAKVWRTLYGETSLYQGIIDIELEASGLGSSLKDWDMSADLRMRQMQYRSQRIPNFITRVRLQNGVAEFLTKQKDFVIKAEADVTQKRLKGRFSADLFELETLAGLFNIQELSGALQIQGTVKGELSSPEIVVDVEGKNIHYQYLPIDTLMGQVQYRDNQIHLSHVFFSGTADTIDTLSAPFHIQNIRGGIEYKGKASGSLDDLRATLTAEFREPGYQDINFDRGDLKIEVKDSIVTLSKLNMQKDSLLIQARGEFSLPSKSGSCAVGIFGFTKTLGDTNHHDRGKIEERNKYSLGEIVSTFEWSSNDKISLNIDGDQLDFNGVKFVVKDIPDMSGLCRFHLNFIGNMSDPKAELTFNVEKPRYELVEIDSMKGRMTFGESQLQLHSFDLFHKDQYSWASGILGLEKKEDGLYNLSKESMVSGQAQGQDIDLRLLHLFLPEDMELSGQGSFDLKWDGTVAAPHVTGAFALHDGVMSFGPDKPAVENIQLTATLEDSILKVEKVNAQVRETPFFLEGYVTASQWRRFNFQLALSISDFGVVNGTGIVSSNVLQCDASIRHMDLSIFQPFLPHIEHLGGTAGIDINLSGSPQDPQLDGLVEIRTFALQLPQFDTPIHDGIIKLRFHQNEVTIDSVFMKMGGGAVFIHGDASHSQGRLTALQLQALMNNIQINRPKELIVSIDSADLRYTKQNDFYVFDGDVTFGETRFIHRFQPKDVLAFMKKVDRPSPTPSPLLQQTRLNVRLRESQDIWIDNNLAHLRMRSELGFIGTLAKPNISGRLSIEEGYVLYLDRKFQVTRGIMDFVNPHRVNPIVDLKAEAHMKSYQTLVGTPYTVTISVTGPLDGAVVEVVSDPPLEKSDIVALLTVGATRAQLTEKDEQGKGTSVADILQERLTLLSSQRISGYASQKVGSLLGLDEMTIEGNLFSFGNSWGPQLLASKKLSDRMEVTYTTTVGHMNEQSIRLDYRLSKYFSVEGQTDQRGRSGMDVKYRLRFR